MSDFAPPFADIRFVLADVIGLESVTALSAFRELDDDTVFQVLDEAGKFARDVLAPINASGDRQGCSLSDDGVAVADGFSEAYGQFVESGWQSLSGSSDYGGMALPEVVASAAFEMWQAANLSFSLCPMLTSGAITAVSAHASEELKQRFLPGLISGVSSGTMNLTEPQAGSDLAAITTRAVPDGDHYRLHGSKIFITWGDQPFSENILHLVLARLPDAAEGVRGISMFLVPKYLLDSDGKPGERNDVTVAAIEHKLGIHASPTCVLNFGETDGAVGYLIGQENRGLACMFTMMNHARLEVGIQGLAISERAYQLARSYAIERVQGRAPGEKGRVTIVHHPDVRRMLLVMKAQIEAMRVAAYVTALELDVSHHGEGVQREAAAVRMALLTPIVKAWMTEVAQEVTSLGVQIHGGMGFVEETGAAQHARDARILTIYEGTTGIQANDLVGRKILADEGRAMSALIHDMRATVSQLAENAEFNDLQAALARGVEDLETATRWLLEQAPSDPHAAGCASFNLLMLAGTVIGGWQLVRASLAACASGRSGVDDAFKDSKKKTARFYAAHILPRSAAYQAAATAGSDAIMDVTETDL